MTLLRNRNLIVLFLAQMAFVGGAAMTVTMAGIVGSRLAPSVGLSTLPAAFQIVGVAVGTLPAGILMARVGRKLGFVSAALLAIAAALLAKSALSADSFWVYCLSTCLTGCAVAIGYQFRFAAAESVPAEKSAGAISFILLGSLGGAVIGPQLVASGTLFDDQPMQGALSGSVLLFLFAAIVLAGFKNRIYPPPQSDPDHATQPSQSLLSEPLFLLAIAAGVVGQGVMTFVMTATPLSMHIMDQHSLVDTANVIRAHVLAMYAPSLVSGWLIGRFGERNLMLVGIVAYLLTLGIGLRGHELLHYHGALILLGIGWNFLFVGGTSLLVKTYPPAQRVKAQTTNEMMVFGTSALGSLLAGTVLAQLGWGAILWSVLPAILGMGLAIIWLRTRPAPTFSTD